MQHNYVIICLYLFIINNMWNNRQPLLPTWWMPPADGCEQLPFFHLYLRERAGRRKGVFMLQFHAQTFGDFGVVSEEETKTNINHLLWNWLSQIRFYEQRHWAAHVLCPRSEGKLPRPRSPKSLLPKPLNPSYLHSKTCLSVIVPNCRSVKKPIISKLCFCVCW